MPTREKKFGDDWAENQVLLWYRDILYDQSEDMEDIEDTYVFLFNKTSFFKQKVLFYFFFNKRYFFTFFFNKRFFFTFCLTKGSFSNIKVVLCQISLNFSVVSCGSSMRLLISKKLVTVSRFIQFFKESK